MIKKIAMYNLFTFFFSLVHIIYNTIFFKIYLPFILKIYIFLFPINSLFFMSYLFIKQKNKYISPYVYMLCSTMKLFFSIFVFFYSIIDCYGVSHLSFLLKAFIHFIFSYFMILIFRVIFLLN
ncbi:hypothetical protein STAT_572 [Blattabacterium cuenoti STAT]|uniref:Uncharacterized protein n=1 Tax=Blattabacterium cuenoti STAT TaxID=1457030 RepID=A0A224AC56_9FLAO|nr:hypothetical protein STAT_572 [Blattabacterium cuenoti STAT]